MKITYRDIKFVVIFSYTLSTAYLASKLGLPKHKPTLFHKDQRHEPVPMKPRHYTIVTRKPASAQVFHLDKYRQD